MYFIGIDLGGTNIKVGIVNENGEILIKDSVLTYRNRSFQEIIKDMAMLAQKLIKSADIDLKEVKCIGVGTPGTSNDEKGILGYSNNFNFRDVLMRDEIQKYINLPVYLENDANCAALAESVSGAARGTENSVSITIGTGIGSGVIIGGKIFSGFNHAASEMGHTLIKADGLLCTCGRHGCWEMYASATALIEQTKDMALMNPDSLINELVCDNIENIGARTPFIAAKQGDKTAIKVIENYIGYLAEGVVNVINAFQPEILTIGGGVSNEGDDILEPMKKIVYQRVYSRGDIMQTKIKISGLGNDAGIIGAAMIGKNK